MIASKDQREAIVELAGHILLRERGIDLFTLEREEANEVRLSLDNELRTGRRDPEPPNTDRRIYAV